MTSTLRAALCGTALMVLAGGTAMADHHGDGGHDLVGAWTWGGEWTATFTEHGYLVGSHDGVAMAILTWEIEGDTLTVRDVSPPPNAPDAECAMSTDGVYTIAMDGDAMDFTLVEDPCEGRAGAFGNNTLVRRTMPMDSEPDGDGEMAGDMDTQDDE